MKVTDGGDDNDDDGREDIPVLPVALVYFLVLRHATSQVAVGKVTQENLL
jgi:hypothetical protein